MDPNRGTDNHPGGLAQILEDIKRYRSGNASSLQGINGNPEPNARASPSVRKMEQKQAWMENTEQRPRNFAFPATDPRNEMMGSRNENPQQRYSGQMVSSAGERNNMDSLTESLRATRLRNPQGPQLLQHLDSEIASLKAQLVRSTEGSSLDEIGNATSSDKIDLPHPSRQIEETATSSSSSGVDCQEGAVSMISFTSSMEGSTVKVQGDSKADVAASFLSSLSSSDSPTDMIQTMQVLSRDPSMADILRESGCIAHLIQFLHPGDVWQQSPRNNDVENMARANEVMINILRHQSATGRKVIEQKVLYHLDHIRMYSLHMRMIYTGMKTQNCGTSEIRQVVVEVTRSSFNEEARETTRTLGGTQALCELLIGVQLVYPNTSSPEILEIRKLIGMALTNLTFGDDESKKVLCRFPRFLNTVNSQINSPTEELRQVFASVVRNLSWKADQESKTLLKDSGTVASLVKAGMEAKEEGILKSILSALWNLSFHSSENKEEICRIEGALEFLVNTLKHRSSGQRGLELVENGSGILRNISNHIALNENYRVILRENECFRLLVGHLSSPSLTIVANSCGTLWNLSARCTEDQKTLWKLGAEPRLRSLIHSKHKNIAQGASNALKNLWSCRPSEANSNESSCISLLGQRRMRALESELMESSGGSATGGFCGLANSMERSSSDRRRTPSKAVVEMMGDLVNPVPWSQVTSQYQSEKPQRRIVTSASNNSLQRSTKEEIMEADKAAVQRFHNSLRRSRKPDMESSETVKPEGDMPKSFHVEGTPLMSHAGSENDLREPLSVDVRRTNASAPEITDSAPLSPERVKSYACEGTPKTGASMCPSPTSARRSSHENAQPERWAVPAEPKTPQDSNPAADESNNIDTPLMFSRQSSMESLESAGNTTAISNINSVYSTRPPTGMVTPNDLPDSPGEGCRSRAELNEHVDEDQDAAEEPIVSLAEDDAQSGPKIFHNSPGKMSSGSSLSALTIDDEIRIKPSKPIQSVPSFQAIAQASAPVHTQEPVANEEDPEYATFVRLEDHSDLLERSIKSVLPDPSFKSPKGSPPKRSKASKQRDYQHSATFPDLGSAWDQDAYQPDESEIALMEEAINAAMPKPKRRDQHMPHITSGKTSVPSGMSPRHRGKNVAIAKPIVRRSSAAAGGSIPSSKTYPAPEDPHHGGGEEPKTFACEGTPGNPSRSTSLERNSSSAFRNVKQQQQATATSNSAESSPRHRVPSDAAKMKASLLRNIGSPARSRKQQAVFHGRSQLVDEEKGILESSGISLLVDSIGTSHSSANAGSFMICSGMSTALEDIQPPDELMQMSGISSCSFMRNSATSEKVRDASNLLRKDSGSQVNPAMTMPRSSEAKFQEPAGPAPIRFHHSDGGESLSEDNYSPLEDDENFDIAPEDIDLSLVEEDANKIVDQLKNAADLLDDGELLIECETYSLVSNDSKVSDTASSAVDPASIAENQAPRPRIVIPSKSDDPNVKAIRGGGKKSRSKLSPGIPKVAVRTTKTAELRARKAAGTESPSPAGSQLLHPRQAASSPHNSSNNNHNSSSDSISPSSRKNSNPTGSIRSASPKVSTSKLEPAKKSTSRLKNPMKFGFGSSPSSKDRGDTESSDGGSSSKGIIGAEARPTKKSSTTKSLKPPPVPPKPRLDKKKESSPSSEKSARTQSPLQSGTNRTSKSSSASPRSTGQGNSTNSPKKDESPTVVKGSSKRLLVTTV